MHALVAARLGEMADAARYFTATGAIDLGDTSDGSAGGVHIAALGGLWQAAVLGFGGVTLAADALKLDPRLPSTWQGLGFHVHWHGRLVRVWVDPLEGRTTIRLQSGDPMPVEVAGQRYDLPAGGTLVCDYTGATDASS